MKISFKISIEVNLAKAGPQDLHGVLEDVAAKIRSSMEERSITSPVHRVIVVGTSFDIEGAEW